MNIQVIEPPAPIHDEHQEVWVKVQSHEVVDFFDWWDELELSTRDSILDRTVCTKRRDTRVPMTCYYMPDRPWGGDDDPAEGRFIDWWVFPLKQPKPEE